MLMPVCRTYNDGFSLWELYKTLGLIKWWWTSEKEKLPFDMFLFEETWIQQMKWINSWWIYMIWLHLLIFVVFSSTAHWHKLTPSQFGFFYRVYNLIFVMVDNWLIDWYMMVQSHSVTLHLRWLDFQIVFFVQNGVSPLLTITGVCQIDKWGCGNSWPLIKGTTSDRSVKAGEMC